MPFLKKNAAVLAIALALILILAIGLPTYTSKENGTFYLKDLSGSREALNGVTITGELSDGYQRTSFSLRDGKLDAETQLKPSPLRETEFTYTTGSKVIPDRFYGVNVNGRQFEIMSYVREEDHDTFTPKGKAVVNPPLIHASDKPNGYPSRLDYGVAAAGDRVYFTVPVPSNVSGKGIIYELNFNDWWSQMDQANPRPARIVVQYGLQTEGKSETHGIEVIGLESVGNKLILLTAENDSLRLRSYDSESGAPLGEARLPDFRLSSDVANTDAYGYDYQSSSEEDKGRLYLNFKGISGTKSILLSVNLTDGVKIENAGRIDLEDSATAASRSFASMRERNGKLYVFKSLQEPRNEETPQPLLDIALPVRAYLLVFERSSLIYQGELITDINDDRIEAINWPTQDPSFGYSDIGFRTFKKIKIE